MGLEMWYRAYQDNDEQPTAELPRVSDAQRDTGEYPAVGLHDRETQEAETPTRELPRVSVDDTQPLDTAEIRRKAWEFEHRFDDEG